jgi:hypothetical protein
MISAHVYKNIFRPEIAHLSQLPASFSLEADV